MKIEEILEKWNKDSEIDKTELGLEAIHIAKLHHKYYSIYIGEKLLLRKQEAELKSLKLDKYEFFSMGPTKDTPKDWELPPRGKILKQDMPMYLEADKDIINLSLKIGYTQEKVEMLESIIKSIMNRGFHVRAAIDFYRFTQGG